MPLVTDLGSEVRHAPFETNQVTHCSDREIRHEVHSMCVNCINGFTPVINSSPVRVENAEIQGRVTCKWV